MIFLAASGSDGKVTAYVSIEVMEHLEDILNPSSEFPAPIEIA
jgi:hypothetical protein